MTDDRHGLLLLVDRSDKFLGLLVHTQGVGVQRAARQRAKEVAARTVMKHHKEVGP